MKKQYTNEQILCLGAFAGVGISCSFYAFMSLAIALSKVYSILYTQAVCSAILAIIMLSFFFKYERKL